MKKDIKYIIIIFLFAILYFLWIPNFYVGDDTLFHTSNIIANARAGIGFHKILPIIENNMGYGVNIFYPPLPHYVGGLFYRVSGDIEFSMKLLQFFSFFLAGVMMYFYLHKVTGNREQAFLGGLIYQSMPYLFTDVFARGAFNEGFLFFLLPIIFMSFYYLVLGSKRKFYIYFVLGFSLSIYTHLVLTIYITLFSCIYLFVFYRRKVFCFDCLKSLLLGSMIVLGLTFPFWGLLVEHYLLGIYYVFSVQYVRGKNFFTYPFGIYLYPNVMLSGARNPLRFYLTPVSYFFIVFVYLLPFRNREVKDKRYFFSMVFIFLICIILESFGLVWDFIPNLFRNIQFPWRLSLIVAFCISVIASYGIYLFDGKVRKMVIVLGCLFMLGVNFYYSYSLPSKNSDSYLDVGSSSIFGWQKEYLPVNALDTRMYFAFMEEDFSRKSFVKVIENSSDRFVFEVSSLEKEIELQLPKIYYLGYELKNQDGDSMELHSNSSGLLEATILKDGVYTLKYCGTLLSKISGIVFLFSLFIFMFIMRKI